MNKFEVNIAIKKNILNIKKFKFISLKLKMNKNEKDFVFLLNDHLKEINQKEVCTETDLDNFNSILIDYKNPNSKISEYLLIKLKNSIITKLDTENLIELFKLDNNLTDFELNLTLENLTSILKCNKASTHLIEVSIKLMELCNHKISLKIVILLKTILKNLQSNQTNVNQLNIFLDKSIKCFNSIDLEDVISDTTNIFSSVYLLNKYLKCISLYMEHFEVSKFPLMVPFLNRTLQNVVKTDIFKKIEEINPKNLSVDLQVKFLIFITKILVNLEARAELKGLTEGLNRIYFVDGDNFRLDLIYCAHDDDTLIDLNLMCLKSNSNLFEFYLNRHVLFVKLLKSVSFDYEVLIDWLISNETNFLLYFLRYLKFLFADLNQHGKTGLSDLFSAKNQQKMRYFNCIVKSPRENAIESYLEETLELLRKLNVKIRLLKRSFPYNCEPLIKLLEKINNLIN